MRPYDGGSVWGKRELALSPSRLTFLAMPLDVSDVRVTPTDAEVQEGESLTLTCEAESNQDLEFEWLRDKVPRCLWDCGQCELAPFQTP